MKNLIMKIETLYDKLAQLSALAIGPEATIKAAGTVGGPLTKAINLAENLQVEKFKFFQTFESGATKTASFAAKPPAKSSAQVLREADAVLARCAGKSTPATDSKSATFSKYQEPARPVLSRAQFDSLWERGKAQFFKDGGKLVDDTAVSLSSIPAKYCQEKLSRAEFDKLSNQGKSNFLKAGGKITV